jgi:hypothetical protein
LLSKYSSGKMLIKDEEEGKIKELRKLLINSTND